MKEIWLNGGPGAGKTFTVPNISDVIYFATVDRVDITTSADLTKQTLPVMRKAAYRCRRIAASGHPVHNKAQQVLFDYIGDA